MPAISLIGFEASKMIDFEGELRYLTTMCMVRMMCRSGLLTEKEYRQIDTMFIAKYQPKIGVLLLGISLTNAEG